jgi:uncharacterized protein DUF4037
LRDLAASLDADGGAAGVTDYGAWGPWIDGGARLTVEGHRMAWHYRDIDWVRSVIEYLRAGVVRIHYQPGLPHGFHDDTSAAEIALARVLRDPDGELGRLRGLVAEYPATMRRAIIDQGLREASLTLDAAAASAARGDVAFVAGSAVRVVASLVRVLHAVDGAWLPGDKGSVARVARLAVAPVGFADAVEGLLSAPGRTSAELAATLAQLRELLASVADLPGVSADPEA